MGLTITRVGRHKLKRPDGTVISEHTDPDEAVEKASTLPPGEYELEMAKKKIKVNPQPTPVPGPTPTPPPIGTPPTSVLTLQSESAGTITVSTAGTQAHSGATMQRWDIAWGDGTVEGGPGAPPATKSHAYALGGTYAIQLSVRDSNNMSSQASLTASITVNPPTPIPPTPPTPTPAPPSGRTLLAQADITYDGYYDVQTNSTDSPYGQALTLRRVDGQLRFLTFDYYGVNGYRLNEFAIGATPLGGVINTVIQTWTIGPMTTFTGIWFDESTQLLWSTSGPDYTTDFFPTMLASRTLNSDGTISNQRGGVVLSGIPGKRTYGGIQPVPADFQAAYGVGPFVIGWGGYTSLLAQGGGASLGLALYAIPNSIPLAPGAVITPAVLADHVSGSRNDDWYKNTGAQTPSSFDRGIRVTTDVENYFDSGDPRPNPSTPPTEPSIGNWLSPAPDGYGRWTWGDSHYFSGCWIQTANKEGFVTVAALAGGKAYYQSSSTSFDRRVAELHVYDPAQFGQAVQGTRPVWNVRPTNLWNLTLPGFGADGAAGSTIPGNIAAACYDPVGGKLYLYGFQCGGTFVNRLYVFSVAQ